MSRPFLRHIKMESFGTFSDKVVGPFSPGLNVVFGPNEAGKTTVASFVGGVLFGWREARGSANTYKPANAERAGSLFFETPEGDEELSRARNADGLKGRAALVSDVDKETFQTVFSLTSDELRGLRNTSEVTARLLTAGSGTGSSPAQALAEVESRLAGFTSRAAGAEKSLVRIRAEKDELRALIAQAGEDAERTCAQDRELRDMAPQREELKARLSGLNAEVEALCALRAQVEKLDAEEAALEEELAALADEEEELRAAAPAAGDAELAALARLGAPEERALRDRIDALAAEEAKREHAVDLAQDNYATAKAAHEALLEAQEQHGQEGYRRRQRTVQVGLSVGIPALFALAGVLLLLFGGSENVLSHDVLGVVMIVLAAVMASAAAAMLLRPSRDEEARAARREDSQWVVLQDEKKLAACEQAREETRRRVRDELDGMGLASAHGSVRQARELLDEARELRAAQGLQRQRRQSLTARRAKIQANLEKARAQRRRLFEDAPLHGEPTLAAVDAALAAKTRRRDELMETSEELNRRFGELEQRLAQERGSHDFDELKQRYQDLLTREDDCAQECALLLLAKRILVAAVASWESESQPEVYRRASRLLADMTGGRWVKVELSEDGRLWAQDAVRTRRDPARLSLGTRQQLYLALRIALLQEAEGVGRAVPVLADDILVNFDSARRAGAARALAELAQSRQVILFTCHEEVVEALRAAAPDLNELSL